MNQRVLESLSEAKDLFALEKTVRRLCEPFGKLKEVDLLPDAAPGYIVCRIEMDSPQHYAAMLKEFGGAYIGNSIYFNIPLPGQDKK